MEVVVMIDQDLIEVTIKAIEEVAEEEIVAEVEATVAEIEAEGIEAEVREVVSLINQCLQLYSLVNQCHLLSIISDSNSRETNQIFTSIISILAQEFQEMRAGKERKLSEASKTNSMECLPSGFHLRALCLQQINSSKLFLPTIILFF
jgi:hypothetical protein